MGVDSLSCSLVEVQCYAESFEVERRLLDLLKNGEDCGMKYIHREITDGRCS